METMETLEPQAPQKLSIKNLIDLVLRRKALIAGCILSALAIGLVFYLQQPKVYQSSSLLNYQQQKINPAQMSPDVDAKIKDILSTLTEIVTSRTNLLKIINEEGLYKEERARMPIEDVLVIMRKHISITPSRRGDTFVVSFEAINPEKVARVTNALATGFITENMKYREEKASETSTYTQDELNMAKVMLDKKEAVMRDYKLKYYNELPEQRAVNMASLTALQTQYQSRQESIQDLERTRLLIRDQIEVRRQLLSNIQQGSAQTLPDNKPGQIVSDADKLVRLQNELQDLQGRYTDLHPQIKSLQKKIAVLKETQAHQAKQGSATEKDLAKPPAHFDQTLFELQSEIKGIALNIENLNKEKENILSLIKQHQQWVAAAPVREAEWSALTRDYGQLKQHYDFLVSRNLQAESAMNLEIKQKGSQFAVVDSAQTPTKPVKPDFLKIMAVALILGCGLGGGLTIIFGLQDTTFRDPTNLAQTFGLEVICSVPHLSLEGEISRKRIWTILESSFFLLWGTTIVAAVVYFWQQGQIII